MTWYRRISYPAASNADVPDDLWREFQRIRNYFNRLDQNNTRQDGVERDRIAHPMSSAHSGVSDVGDVDGAFAHSSDAATVTLVKSRDDGLWIADSSVSIDVYSQWDAYWTVGFSAEFKQATATDYSLVDLTIGVDGEPASVAPGFMDVNNIAAATAAMYEVFIPAGTTTIRLLYRARWEGAYTGSISYRDRDLFAFGLYR